MIKVALKHFIYETCINQLFSAIEQNFPVLPEGELWKSLRPGMKLSFFLCHAPSTGLVGHHNVVINGVRFFEKVAIVSFQELNPNDGRWWTHFIRCEHIMDFY